ncbi:MAG TPA: 50S ribosomal protein L23 [Dehalococcoidia bacterium]|nr:50S ribosomal protein L23 [Dehalococcoidia bacterium]
MPKQLHAYGILLRPLITEKAQTAASPANEAAAHKYTFAVDKRANKMQIKEAVEVAFSVEVKSVNTMMMKGKMRRYGRSETKQPDWKKAVVTLVPGAKIDLFEGV